MGISVILSPYFPGATMHRSFHSLTLAARAWPARALAGIRTVEPGFDDLKVPDAPAAAANRRGQLVIVPTFSLSF